MPRYLIAAAAAALAAPAVAQPAPDPLEEEIVRAIPPADEVEAMAPALDRAVGALLNVDVGPLIDAVDPYRRRRDYGRPGRTLGDIGRRDDPYFEERLRSSIYGTTADMGRMMEGLAAAAPSLARSVRELERAMDAAMGDYRRRRGDRPEHWDEPEPYPDE